MSIDVSVIIPTFRRPEKLAKAIASALDQDRAALEIIVADDSPEGSAREVVESARDARIRYLKIPTPTGGVPSIVRNQAWPLARGRLVHFLDDDDIAPKGHYAAVCSVFAEHPDVGIVFGRIEPFGSAPEEQLRHEREFFADAARRASRCQRFGRKWAFTGQMMFNATLLVCSAGVVRRECLEVVGGFDPSIRLGEDVDLYARIMREFGAHFVDRVTLHFHIGYPSLFHAPQLSEGEREELWQAIRLSHEKYRRRWGSIDYYALKMLTRGLLRFI